MEASTVVNNCGAKAIDVDTSTAKSAAVEASTSKATTTKTAAAMATAATTARQRHGRRGQANGCNSQQCEHFPSQHYHSPSEIDSRSDIDPARIS